MLDVYKLLTQQQEQVRDSRNRRWIRCRECGCVDTIDKFWTYGGKDSVNLGECYDCLKSRRNNS